MSDLKCDFCSQQPVIWRYPANPFSLDEIGIDPQPGSGVDARAKVGGSFGELENFTTGDWTACGPCHDTIERKDWRALAMRAAKHGDYGDLQPRYLLPFLEELHQAFVKHRTGPPNPISAIFNAPTTVVSVPVPPAARRGQEVMRNVQIPVGATDKDGNPIPLEEVLREYGIENLKGEGTLIDRGDGDPIYIPEGFTPEELAQPDTLKHILGQMGAAQALRSYQPGTTPIVLPEIWEGSRSYKMVIAATYGENPRHEDAFMPSPAMMNARHIFPALAQAHPIVIEPRQMNSIDETDWSFCEAHDYARMAHLPFEPVFLDFGADFDGESVRVPFADGAVEGEADLVGALVWRSERFGGSLAVAPFGGWDLVNTKMSDAFDTLNPQMRERWEALNHIGRKPANDRALRQWRHQPYGIIFFGPDIRQAEEYDAQHPVPYVNIPAKFRNHRLDGEVNMMHATPTGIALAVQEDRLVDDPFSVLALVSTGLDWPGSVGDFDPENESDAQQATALSATATAVVCRMAERALLGLYFLENAPVTIKEADLSRQVRRQMQREGRTKTASIIQIKTKRYEGNARNRSGGEPSFEGWTHRVERKGYFMHYHENNRHYQNRPDLIADCHKCRYEYEANQRTIARGDAEVPFPKTESRDCIKKWVEPTIVGPPGAPLKTKVRVKRRERWEIDMEQKK